jgi:hypothetical protein
MLSVRGWSNIHEVLFGFTLLNDYNVKDDILYKFYNLNFTLEIDQIEEATLVPAIKDETKFDLRRRPTICSFEFFSRKKTCFRDNDKT